MAVRPHWRSTVTFSEDGPGVTLMHESPELKVVLVGLGVGQSLPVHPGPSASFHFLARWRGCHGCRYRGGRCGGGGDGGRSDGRLARVRATSRLVFLGSLGEPGAPKEDGPH